MEKGGRWVRMGSKTPNHRVKDLLRRIGVDPTQYGSHSCRKGGCSKAAAAGVELRVLKRHGRWKSWAVFLYIHDSVKKKLEVTSALYKYRQQAGAPQSLGMGDCLTCRPSVCLGGIAVRQCLLCVQSRNTIDIV